MATVPVFFYGSYMSRQVLAEVGLRPDRLEAARLDGYEITIGALANLVDSPGAAVWGVVATATHDELERLYAHAQNVLGGVYLPRPVLVTTDAGEVEPALCYVADDLPQGNASAAYVERILEPARELGFPEEYIERLESFLPR